MNASGVPKETNARHIENKILRSYLGKRTAIEVAVSDAIVFDFGQYAEHREPTLNAFVSGRGGSVSYSYIIYLLTAR
jgi:hypothetical protein